MVGEGSGLTVGAPGRADGPCWDEEAATAAVAETGDRERGLCLYASRLLGSDPELVLHGGGNSSVEGRWQGDGASRAALFVKATGSDMARLAPADLVAVDLEGARTLLDGEPLAEPALRRAMRDLLLDTEAAAPSIETLLHAALPRRFVLHAHSDALLAATQTPDGAARAEDLFGDDFLILPYEHSGHDLARAGARAWSERATAATRGLILLHHGLFVCADDARTAFDWLLEAVARAAATLPATLDLPSPPEAPQWRAHDLDRVEAHLAALAGQPLAVQIDERPLARAFAALPAVADLVRRGPLTPGHCLHTRQSWAALSGPDLLEAELDADASHRTLLQRRVLGIRAGLLDPAPRVVVARGLGLVTAGATPADAAIAADFARHSIPAWLAAEALGGYRPLPPEPILELELTVALQRRHG